MNLIKGTRFLPPPSPLLLCSVITWPPVLLILPLLPSPSYLSTEEVQRILVEGHDVGVARRRKAAGTRYLRPRLTLMGGAAGGVSSTLMHSAYL